MALIHLSKDEKRAAIERLREMGVEFRPAFSAVGLDANLRRTSEAVTVVLAELGIEDTRKIGFRADPPDYRELGMTRVSGPPTPEEIATYREVTMGGELGEDGFVCQVLLCDTDLLPDRYGVISFRGLTDLMAKYLGRANDVNHSFDQNEAAGRIIGMGIGSDPNVVLHPDRPTAALEALDPLNPYAGAYCALWATMAFPNTGAGAKAIADIKAGLVQDVSIAWSVAEQVCSICVEPMQRDMCGSYCEEHGSAGGRDDDGNPIVSIYNGARDAFVFGHVSDGAVRRARYVNDPDAGYDMEDEPPPPPKRKRRSAKEA